MSVLDVNRLIRYFKSLFERQDVTTMLEFPYGMSTETKAQYYRYQLNINSKIVPTDVVDLIVEFIAASVHVEDILDASDKTGMWCLAVVENIWNQDSLHWMATCIR